MESNVVSVIVPVYNAEKYIKECVQSVLSQTYKDWELILVDDGSTDCSGTFCDQFAQVDSRISVIHQENAGVSRARAKGVFSSTGNFVYFLDADDTIENDTLEYMVALFNDDIDLVVTDYKKNFILEWEKYAEILLGHGLWYACMKLYRRRLFDEYVFDTPRYFKTGEDFLMQLRILKNMKGRVLCSTVSKYHYREVETSASRAFVPTMEYEIQMLHQVQKLISFLPESERLAYAHFKFRVAWLGGMIGLQYPISYQDKWVVDILRDSTQYKLTLKEKISVLAVRWTCFRCFLIFEKKLKHLYRICVK